jgi:hypothetical protein
MLLAAFAPTATADPFGVKSFDGSVLTQDPDVSFTQAGGHPFALTTSIAITTHDDSVYGSAWPDEPIKDILVDTPVGLVGNPTIVPRCSLGDLARKLGCPTASQVGIAHFTSPACFSPGSCLVLTDRSGLFNMVPPPGVPARLGFAAAQTIITLDVQVRTGSDYGLSVNARNVSQGLPITATSVTLWGVPADPSHDSERRCHLETDNYGCAAGVEPRAFLTMPTACAGLQTTNLHLDSWFHPGQFVDASFTSHGTAAEGGGPIGVTGCDQVPFTPSFTAKPQEAKSPGPSGWSFDLTIPQDTIGDPNSIAQSALKTISVALPKGVRVSPSSADGLGACSPAQIALKSDANPTCPDASKIGTVTAHTPLLEEPLTGGIYLATPHDNPSHSLVAIYLVLQGSGVTIKLAGSTTPDPKTGQLSATFGNLPQQPISDTHLEFFGGARAALSNPPRCGTYTTKATLSSWSGKTVESDSTFTTTHDGNGQPCPEPKFQPSFAAGIAKIDAGRFTPFALRMQRSDDDQEFGALRSLSLPPGLLADVGSVSVRCTEGQARAAACPAGSHIGTVLTGAGAGTGPFYVPGDVYLMGGFSSGPFKGDPFGLAVVVHALAGPFDLGYVVVEAGVQVHDDGSISAQTEPFPTILQGIPLQLRDIRLKLDRPNFILNPTNCSQMAVAGSVVSTEGMTAPVSSRFQVGECAALGFKPSFTVSTAGKTSKANGASLHVHVGTHEGPSSTGATGESNIAKVDVQLPVVLPARLPTLQKACTAAQFASDPAGCPVGSFVGTAVAHTPILVSPLSGPAILVSHGGQAFPDLVLVLQGEGVRINLTGHTQIKKGITFNHFETVPDAPVSSFDLTLPAGPHGVLTTDIPGRNLCATTKTVTVTKRVTRRVNGHTRRVTVKAKKAVAAPLLMPTTMTAQNGAVIHQNTRIAVTGCAKTVRHERKKAHQKRRKE